MRVGAWLAIGIVSLGSAAHAQEGTWHAPFDAAVAHMADGEFDEAAALFGRAYELGAGPAALFNRGIALTRANRHAAAFRTFDLVLSEHAAGLPPHDVADLVERRRVAVENTGVVRVRARTIGGELSVDGERVGALARGESVELRADVGARRVELRWGELDAMAAVIEVNVTAGETSEASFAPELARLRVSGADRAQISIEGTPVGRGAVDLTLRAGLDLDISAAGVQGVRRVSLLEGRTLDVDLRPAEGIDAVVLAVLIGAAALLAGGVVAVSVWGADQVAPPHESPPYGVIEVLREAL
jgi:hypothetical protein